MSANPRAAADTAHMVAAVDLGSNSFHMIVARSAGRELHIVDRLKESVRLAAGLDERRRLTPEARDRALDTLARFGQRLRHLPPGRVRAVGTNTLRRARGVGDFLGDAEAALGHPIEIIYGAEEARLIYGGVAQDLGVERPRRLVADIGGGSTELIVGELATPELMESVSLGAVTHSQRYFAGGYIDKSSWRAAILDARVRLEPLAREYRRAGWDVAVGASGSIKAVQKVAQEAGWAAQAVTRDALERIGKALVKAGHIDRVKLSGLSDDRRPIFPGGTAVLAAIFESLGVEAMEVSDKALREGLLLDLLGRLEDHDVRADSVAAAAARYGVDRAHAERVAATAGRLFAQVPGWAGAPTAAPRMLDWAARLHEIGLAIAHKGYHKHGEYIVRQADLQGFSQTEQLVLAILLRLHRGKFRTDIAGDLPKPQRVPVLRLAILLRLAVLLHRGRDPEGAPPVHLETDGDRLRLSFDPGWLAAHPLTYADLLREAEALGQAGYELVIRDP
ncbi:Ppx/GppA phosphatase [Salinisphaera sp. PC39]